MIRGLYGAASALDTAERAQEATAQNLAHCGVPGYRARGVAFEPFDRALDKQIAPGSPLGGQVSRTFVDFKAGALQYTNRTYDMAVDGDNFFVVDGPNGRMYTRNGNCTRANDGRLTTESGYPLAGDAGPIIIPDGAKDVQIGRDGTVRADRVPVGKIQLARFTDPSRLVPVGTTLFADTGGAGRQDGTNGVLQGYRESSNVQPAAELVAMIRTSRYAEAAQRALRSLSESVQLNTRPQ